MTTPRSKLEQAFEHFDRVNEEDPNREQVDGLWQPKELAYSRRMTDRLDRFAPGAPEPLRLAARCQHIKRWTIPRSDYPEGRAGYRTWRTTLLAFHAATAAAILREVGYDEATIGRVEVLLRKENLKGDGDVQTLEDVVCLVFLEHYLEGFASEQDEAKVIDILGKTWRKMSERGHTAARELGLAPRIELLLDRATRSPTPDA